MSFETEMIEDLMGYKNMIGGWLRTRYPQIYSESLEFDAHSSGILSVLSTGYTGLCPQERTSLMFKSAIAVISDVYKNIKILDNGHERFSVGKVNFAKLDQRFCNYLSVRRSKIWKLKCEGMTNEQIAECTGLTKGCIAVEIFWLKKSYAIWLRRIVGFDPANIDKLHNRKYNRDVMRMYYVEGYSLLRIALEMNITVNYVCQILYICRKYLEEKHKITVPVEYIY